MEVLIEWKLKEVLFFLTPGDAESSPVAHIVAKSKTSETKIILVFQPQGQAWIQDQLKMR